MCSSNISKKAQGLADNNNTITVGQSAIKVIFDPVLDTSAEYRRLCANFYARNTGNASKIAYRSGYRISTVTRNVNVWQCACIFICE
eukprot:m.1380471 g.1380471  ORF g.1380471 m.1380471 type:complete len:87 (-) comp24969_c7_seq15:1601-1861(-)